VVIIPFILLGVVVAYLAIESVLINRWRNKLPIRIHVNGTRGKSSVTRYIAAGLRASGRRPLAKVTGVRPTIIYPDGKTSIIKRRGPANVREQLRMFFTAHRYGCDAIVLECMSIVPALQKLETRILQPHITVLTNISDDHREELGKSDEERTEAYCSSLPSNAIVVTNDLKHLASVQETGRLKNTKVIVPSNDFRDSISSLPQEIIRNNVALALTVCESFGVERRLALIAILAEATEQTPFHKIFMVGEQKVHFVNGFAVNDVPSAISFLDLWKKTIGGWDKLVFVINTRADRPLRSVEFATWCSSLDDLSEIILIGSHVPFMKRELVKFGYPVEKISFWSERQIQSPIDSLKRNISEPTAVFGFGNIAGDGFLLIDALEKSSTNRMI
jgi:gamma-polyglutamate synthase